jgi:hypothetical protein
MKGIIFTEPLFRKVASGEKTQTRRIIKPQPDFISENFHWAKKNNGDVILPRYKPGETLYLKEPYHNPDGFPVTYKYDGFYRDKINWQNKLFMPAKYAHYFIEITGVRCERLQDISESDCRKEGIPQDTCSVAHKRFRNPMNRDFYYTGRDAYAALIDSINGKGTWERNPFVFVYDFRLTTK